MKFAGHYLSIVVPVYNAEKYIANCLDSLLCQDINKCEYEIICVNDGSTDNSLAIMQEYASVQENIVILDKPNGGVASARNLGLAEARGEYVWFVDADDWIARNCLGVIKSQIINHAPSVIQIHFDWIRAEWRVNECADITLNKENVVCCVDDVSVWRDSGVCSSIIKRQIIAHHTHRFIENLHYGEDLLFMRELFNLMCIETANGEMTHKIVRCQNDIFYYYRQHDESAMHISWTKNKDKYLDALIKMARIDQMRMLDTTKPAWYTEQYTELFYDRMFNYLMNWLPSAKGKWKDHKHYLLKEGLYPCGKPPVKIRRKLTQADGTVAKIKAVYKYCAFRLTLLYPIYYQQMKRKYMQYIAQDGTE